MSCALARALNELSRDMAQEGEDDPCNLDVCPNVFERKWRGVRV